MTTMRIGIHATVIGQSALNRGPFQGDRYLRDTLGQFVEYVPVDPEGECGLGELGDAFRLQGELDLPRLVHRKTGEDVTQRVTDWARRRVEGLAQADLCGFILQGRSPITGMERVRVYDGKGGSRKEGTGPFARLFTERFPLVPVEEDGRLHDPALRESFVDRIFALWRWRACLAGGRRRGRLVDFHACHKLLLLAHSPEHLRKMGKLVGQAKQRSTDALFDSYAALLVEALARKATRKKHTNVLQHVMGYFKKRLSADEKEELLELIGLYHDGFLPLIVPVTLLRHYVRKYEEPYLMQQVYLDPHPVELKLRNHV